jgi:hypothetical protein
VTGPVQIAHFGCERNTAASTTLRDSGKKHCENNDFKCLMGAARLTREEPVGQPAGDRALGVTASANCDHDAPSAKGLDRRPDETVGQNAGRDRSSFDISSPSNELAARADLIDPLSRVLAGSAFVLSGSSVSSQPPLVPPSLEVLLGRFARRMAWGADKRVATARIEVGSGLLAGATITVTSTGRELSVDIDLPLNAVAGAFGERLQQRLSARGFEVRELSVR